MTFVKPMNQRIKLFWKIKAGLMAAMMMAAVSPVMAAPDAAPVVQQLSRSLFTMPTNPKQGRDPFFPSSTRPYQAPAVPGKQSTTDLSSLVLQGIAGAPPHQLVIINNVTFGVGDDAEVRTSQGRIRIHCVAITGNSTVIEANGQESTLHYGDKP